MSKKEIPFEYKVTISAEERASAFYFSSFDKAFRWTKIVVRDWTACGHVPTDVKIEVVSWESEVVDV